MSKNLEISENTLQLEELESGMIKATDYSCIKELYGKGLAKRAIARLLGIDVKTVRNHLKKLVWTPYCRTPSNNKGLLEVDQDWLIKRMPEVDYNASILFRELKGKGYEGSYETVKLFVHPYRPLKSKGCVRYETAPGHQSQVDWGSAWVWLDDKHVKVHFFTMVLGYSRRLYAKGYLDEKFVNLVNGHECAFQWFGGFTQEILYDNARTMVTHHKSRHDVVMNTSFKDFANYYGFSAQFCHPYRPQTKGKIESGVKYLKRNFLPGRRFKSLAHLNAELEKWIIETADQRIHGTTHQRPAERFAKEGLQSIKPFQPYVYVPAIQRKVSQDSMVSWNNNRYSVPWIYVGQCVDLRITQAQLFISHQGNVIASHGLLQGKHQQSTCRQHYAGLLQEQARKKYQGPPQHDPRWQTDVEVEIRDLAIYEVACMITPHSFLTH